MVLFLACPEPAVGMSRAALDGGTGAGREIHPGAAFTLPRVTLGTGTAGLGQWPGSWREPGATPGLPELGVTLSPWPHPVPVLSLPTPALVLAQKSSESHFFFWRRQRWNWQHLPCWSPCPGCSISAPAWLVAELLKGQALSPSFCSQKPPKTASDTRGPCSCLNSKALGALYVLLWRERSVVQKKKNYY